MADKLYWDVDYNPLAGEWTKLQLAHSIIPFPEYRDKPVEFMRDIFDVRLTPEMENVYRSVRDEKITNVQAAHSIGKTHGAAGLVFWYVFAVGGQVITTAPTLRQVKNLLWKEVRSRHARFKGVLGGTCDTLQLALNTDAWATGFSTSDHNPDAFNGNHNELMLLIQDEANGISMSVDDGFISNATGELNRILRIGNPVTPYTPFYYSCEQSHIRLPVWSHPNVAWAYQVMPDGMHRLKPEVADKILNEKGAVKPQSEWPDDLPRDLIPGAVSIAWIEGIRKLRGEGTAYWLGRVEGIFPVDATDSLFPIARLHNLRERSLAIKDELLERVKGHSLSVGLDVGDGGDDSAITILRGRVTIYCEQVPTRGDGFDGDRLSDRTKELDKEFGGFGAIAYDASGVGSWLESPLKTWFKGRVYRVKWGTASTDNTEYANLKVQQFDEAAQLIKGEDPNFGILCAEEHWKTLIKQFAAITRREVGDGSKMYLTPKKELREKLGCSPDLLDSWIIAYSIPLGVTSGKPTARNWISASRNA